MNLLRVLVALLFLFASLPSLPSQAQSTPLPPVGTLIKTGVAYTPVVVKGMTIHPENPFLFDFIVEPGEEELSPAALKDESMKMVKYFLASLTVPEADMWVNLSPYEKDRIVPEELGKTILGRDMLSLDYLLKQLTASLIYPESKLGKEFWSKIYAQSQAKFGTAQVPINTFNKVWIIPDKATVWEHNKSVFVIQRHLKVMLEEDYLAMTKHEGGQTAVGARGTHPPVGAISKANGPLPLRSNSASSPHAMTAQIVREIVIPALEYEINEGKTFAELRQIYNSMILATWYKKRLKDTIIAKAYVDRGKVDGVTHGSPTRINEIYGQYVQAFKKGVFNFIKDEQDPATGTVIPRKYFSGGLNGVNKAMLNIQSTRPDPSQLPTARAVKVVVNASKDSAMFVFDQGIERIFSDWDKLKDTNDKIQFLNQFYVSVEEETRKSFLLYVLMDRDFKVRQRVIELNNGNDDEIGISFDELMVHMREPQLSLKQHALAEGDKEDQAIRNKRLALLIIPIEKSRGFGLPNSTPQEAEYGGGLVRQFNLEKTNWTEKVDQQLPRLLQGIDRNIPYRRLGQEGPMTYWEAFFQAYMDYRLRSMRKEKNIPYGWFWKKAYAQGLRDMPEVGTLIGTTMTKIDQFLKTDQNVQDALDSVNNQTDAPAKTQIAITPKQLSRLHFGAISDDQIAARIESARQEGAITPLKDSVEEHTAGEFAQAFVVNEHLSVPALIFKNEGDVAAQGSIRDQLKPEYYQTFAVNVDGQGNVNVYLGRVFVDFLIHAKADLGFDGEAILADLINRLREGRSFGTEPKEQLKFLQLISAIQYSVAFEWDRILSKDPRYLTKANEAVPLQVPVGFDEQGVMILDWLKNQEGKVSTLRRDMVHNKWRMWMLNDHSVHLPVVVDGKLVLGFKGPEADLGRGNMDSFAGHTGFDTQGNVEKPEQVALRELAQEYFGIEDLNSPEAAFIHDALAHDQITLHHVGASNGLANMRQLILKPDGGILYVPMNKEDQPQWTIQGQAINVPFEPADVVVVSMTEKIASLKSRKSVSDMSSGETFQARHLQQWEEAVGSGDVVIESSVKKILGKDRTLSPRISEQVKDAIMALDNSLTNPAQLADSAMIYNPDRQKVLNGFSYEEARELRDAKLKDGRPFPRDFWSAKITRDNMVYLAFDDLFDPEISNGRSFKELREANDIKGMAQLYRKYVMGYVSKKTKDGKLVGGQKMFFIEKGALKGLLDKTDLPNIKSYSPASLIKPLFPGLVDRNNPDALKPWEIEEGYWEEDAAQGFQNAKDEIWKTLDTVFIGERDVARMVAIYREKILNFPGGQIQFFYQSESVRSIISKKKSFLVEAGSPLAVLQFAAPQLLGPNALSAQEISIRWDNFKKNKPRSDTQEPDADPAMVDYSYESPEIPVLIKKGVHARPSRLLVKIAQEYEAKKIEIEWIYDGYGEEEVYPMTSIMELMKSGVTKDGEIRLRIYGGEAADWKDIEARVRVVLSDKDGAMTAPETGGIDLNANQLDLLIKGQEESTQWTLPGNGSAAMIINGLNPIILKVEPVNLPELIGPA